MNMSSDTAQKRIWLAFVAPNLREEHNPMTVTTEVQSGLEGVVAFATEIAEPDRAGGALRYRGVDIEELVGNVPFEQVWGLLVDGKLMPPSRIR
jgi:citrate synthase